ncbi:MAG: hypothetical protein EOO50_03545 [Flavobacterium sp.]|uniref:hypothetical protein n=1 Tax=Flavobacterium sp. TaxID=239 RepID=UPI001200BED3|nr:hypothetical protein [Flavobacterium sp.]RZJ67908.1 MAG: hypothetical protein EOO50_03545 [Flavobacterium sp.]
MKNIVIVAMLALAFVGCKDEKKAEDAAQPVPEVVKNDFFQVTLDVTVKKDDHFHVYYTEDGSIDFVDDNSVWADVKGSDAPQKVTFNLPKDVLATQLRIDFGWAKDQGEIVINNLEISYLGKTRSIAGADFFKYFRPNEGYTIVNMQNHSVKSIQNDGKVGPSVYPLAPIAEELEKLVSQ